jgi:chromosomal replication initiation ATPase DnaA
MRRSGVALLLQETMLTVEKIGSEKTVSLLRKIRVNDDHSDIIKEHIIKTVCNKYSISKKHLLEETYGESRFDALCMCTLLMKEFLDYSSRKIAIALNRRSHKSVGHYVKRLNDLKPDHPVDKIFIAISNTLKSEIESFKKTLS